MPLFGVGYVVAYRPINSLLPLQICYSAISGGMGGIGQDLSTWGQNEGAKRPSVGRVCVRAMVGEIFEIMCIQMAFFAH